MAKGEDARRKLKQAFPDLETSNAQNRCKFTTSFGFKIAFGKVGHPRHGASTSAFFFQFQKKRGQPGTRYHVAVIPGQRQKSSRETQRPRGSPSRFCREKYFTTSNNCRRWGPTNLGWCQWCQELAWCEAAHGSWFGRSWKIRKCGLVSTVDSCRLQTSHWDWRISNRV